MSEVQFLLEGMSDGRFEVEMWRIGALESLPVDAHIGELDVSKELVGCAVTMPFVEQDLVLEWSVVYLERAYVSERHIVDASFSRLVTLQLSEPEVLSEAQTYQALAVIHVYVLKQQVVEERAME
ncbi:hypothetical protein [Bacillus pumilus]